MTEKGVFYSSISIMILTILRIKNFIPQLFEISNQELDYKENDSNEEGEETSIDYKVELEAFEKHLRLNGISELDASEEKVFLDGKLWLSFLKSDKTEIWLNVHIDVDDVTNVEIRDEVCLYAVNILNIFSHSRVDINSIVMSFHISIKNNDKHSRNIFIRTNRLELENNNFSTDEPIQEIQKINNTLFDKIFRDI